MKASKWLQRSGLLVLAAAACGTSQAQLNFPAAVVRPPDSDASEVLYRTSLGAQSVDNIYGTTTGHTSDVFTTAIVGASVKTSINRQQFLLDAAVSDNEYQSHSELNYTGSALAGGWQWSSGEGLFGAVSGNRTVTQNAIGTSVNTTQRNLNTSQSSTALVGYEFGGGWQASGGVLQSSSVNDQQVYGQALVSQYRGAFAGTTYVFASGNSMSLRTLTGTGTNVYDFNLRTTEFRLDSVTSQGSTVGAQIAYWQQSYVTQSQYDFSGMMGRLAATWQPTEKTSLQWALQRQLYGVPLANSVYTVNDSLTMIPTWQVLPKVALRGNVQRLIINYQGDPGGGNSGEVDTFQTWGASIVWKPIENSEVSLTASQSDRSSNLSSGDVVINTISVVGMFAF